MAEQRRSLIEGIQTVVPSVDNRVEKAFVMGQQPAGKANGPSSTTAVINRVQLSTRIRDDFFKALKRASLERQMDGIEPNTMVEILEEALEPWLRANGFLS